MVRIVEEKRRYPRVKANLKVALPKNISGTSVDVSESGLSFNAEESISSPTISVQFQFSDIASKFVTEAKLVWKRNLDDGTSLYGVEFVDLNEKQKAELRKELIKTQCDNLLSAIKDVKTKDTISRFFLTDLLDYINEVVRLIPHLSKDEYSEELEKRLEHLNTQFLLKGYCLEELLSDKRNMQKVKENFRQLIGTWAYKSVIMKRALDKPRGYPGDYKMLEIVYDNRPISRNIGAYFDNYFLKNPYAVAVRIRKDRLREMLLSFLNGTKSNSKINVLNIACGSCREIRELLASIKTNVSITFNCLDWDDEALQFSKDVLLPISPKNVSFNFLKEDVMNIGKEGSLTQSIGKQDIIYSIGLIDYLPDRILSKLLNALYQLLRKDGKLILTHKNKEKTFPPVPPDWFCDWKFVSRNKDEAVKLFHNCGFGSFSLETEADDFEYIYYFTITKK